MIDFGTHPTMILRRKSGNLYQPLQNAAPINRNGRDYQVMPFLVMEGRAPALANSEDDDDSSSATSDQAGDEFADVTSITSSHSDDFLREAHQSDVKIRFVVGLAGKTNPSNNHSVRFDSVQVHYHARILGDNPAVRRGLPVTLAWKKLFSETFGVEEYEMGRKDGDTVVPASEDQREAWLEEAGHSIDEFIEVLEEIGDIKAARSRAEVLFRREEAQKLGEQFDKLHKSHSKKANAFGDYHEAVNARRVR